MFSHTQNKFPKINKALFFAAIFVFVYIFPALQIVSAQTIYGIVTDRQNAPLQNAEIRLSDRTKLISRTLTDIEGKFSIEPGRKENLQLYVTAKGFADVKKNLPKDFNEPLIIVLTSASISAEVVVSITKTETRLNETPASLVVLNRDNLKNSAAQTIDDTLRQVAGFTLFRRGSSKTTNPTTQGANLRGIGGSGAARTAVLFDGVSVSDAFGGWTYWTRIPKIAVEQAEVLRGGASSLYGGSALSGAIDLQTKKSESPVLRVESSAGVENTFDGNLFTSFGKSGWNFDFAAESFQTAGYIPTAKAERGLIDTQANSRFNNGLLTIERKFSEDLRIFGRANLFKERRDNGTSLTNNRTYFRQTVFGADYSHKTLGAFQLRSSLENQIYDQTFTSVAADRRTENLSRVQRVPSQSAAVNLFWTGVFGAHVISASANAREVRGFSDESVFVNNFTTSLAGAGGKQRTLGFSAQDFWRVNTKLNINFGAAIDDWKDFDALSVTTNLLTNQTSAAKFQDRNARRISPRIGAVYQINKNFSMLAALTNSFRAPTLNELYRAFRVGNVLTRANENLRAETAGTFETGVNFYGFSKRLGVRGNFFVTKVSNPVVSVTLSSAPNLITRQRQNVGATRSRGLELDTEFSPLSKLKISAGFLLVDSRVTEFPGNIDLIGKFLPQIPRGQLTFQAFYQPVQKISLSLQGRFSASQFDDDLNSLRLRRFFVLDDLVSYRISANFSVFAAVENVFNNRYDIGLTPNRTISAPRFARFGVTFNLKKD